MFVVVSGIALKTVKAVYKCSSACKQNIKAVVKAHLTTISVNVCDRALCVCLFESLLLPNRLRYQNMNVTTLSQIVWVMFLAHHCLPKVAKKFQKEPKFVFPESEGS